MSSRADTREEGDEPEPSGAEARHVAERSCGECGRIDPIPAEAPNLWREWKKLYHHQTDRGSAAREAAAREAGRNLDLSHVRLHVQSSSWWLHASSEGARHSRTSLLELLLQTTRYFASPFLLGPFHHEADLGPHTSHLVQQPWFHQSLAAPGGRTYSQQVLRLALGGDNDIANLRPGAADDGDGLLPYGEFLDLYFLWVLPLGLASSAIRKRAQNWLAADKIRPLSTATIYRIRDNLYSQKSASSAINAQLHPLLSDLWSTVEVINDPDGATPGPGVMKAYALGLRQLADRIEFTDPPASERDAALLRKRLNVLDLAEVEEDDPYPEHPTPFKTVPDEVFGRLKSVRGALSPENAEVTDLEAEAREGDIWSDLRLFRIAHDALYPRPTEESEAALACLLNSNQRNPAEQSWANFVDARTRPLAPQVDGAEAEDTHPTRTAETRLRRQEVLQITIDIIKKALELRIALRNDDSDR